MINWVLLHPHLADLAVFLAAFTESLAVVGLIVPGTLLMFGAGALISLEALDLWTTLAWAMAGAVAGDGMSYWLGRHYRERLRGLWPFRRYPQWINRGEAFFERNGAKSVVLGRFVGPVRPIIPAVAGMMGMRPLRFYGANVLSAMAWAPAYILPGVVFGASLAIAGAVAARLATLLIGMTLSFWVVISATKYLVVWLPPRADRALTVFQGWTASVPWPAGVRKIVQDLLDPTHPASRALILLAAVLIAGAWTFLAVLEDVVSGDPLVRADSAVYNLLQGLRTPVADRVAIAVTGLGDAAVILPVVIVVLLWLIWRRAWRVGVYWLGAAGFAALLVAVLKATLQRPRPVPILYEGPYSFAFPSSHATMSFVVYGFLGVLLARELSVRGRWLVFSVALPLVGLIAFSRVYLGAHWFSDVLGGLAFGAVWVALLGIAYLRHPAPKLGARGLAGVAVLTLLVAGAWQMVYRYPVQVKRYALRQPALIIAEKTWWEDGWERLPAWRLDLEGEYEQPFTVQWAGSLESLRNTLASHGWRSPVPLYARNWLLWLDTARPAMELPVLPHIHDGRNERLALIHPVKNRADQRLVFRLWAAQVKLTPGRGPLWVGTVTQQMIHRPVGLFVLPRDGNDFNGPRETLRQALAGIAVREVKRRVLIVPDGKAITWDRQVLLGRESMLR